MDEELKALQTAFEDKIKLAASKEELEKIKGEMKTEIEAIKADIKEQQKTAR